MSSSGQAFEPLLAHLLRSGRLSAARAASTAFCTLRSKRLLRRRASRRLSASLMNNGMFYIFFS